MQKKFFNYLFFSFVAVLLLVSVVSAVWWNPSTWFEGRGITGNVVSPSQIFVKVAYLGKIDNKAAPYSFSPGVGNDFSFSLQFDSPSGLKIQRMSFTHAGGSEYWRTYGSNSPINVYPIVIFDSNDHRINNAMVEPALIVPSGLQNYKFYFEPGSPNFLGGTLKIDLQNEANPITINVPAGVGQGSTYGSYDSHLCNSFTYSAWTPTICSLGSQQTRTVTASSPSGCTGGSPILTRGCNVPTCNSFTYNDFGACQSNNQQSRTVATQSPTGCTGGSPELTRSCTPFVLPANDNFANAISINSYTSGSGSVSVNLNGAGTESGENSLAGNTVWYRFNAPGAGNLNINYNSPTAGGVTLSSTLKLYSGSSLSSLVLLNNNDMINHGQTISLTVAQPGNYYLQFGRSAGNFGAGTATFTYAFQSLASGACIDTDVTATYPDGLNYYLAGSAAGSSGLGSSDGCGVGYYANTVYESYCRASDNSVTTAYYNCPNGCSAGKCLTSSSAVSPSTCSSFTYTLGACQPNGQKTKTVATSSPAGCTGGSPDLTPQSCTYVPPVPTCTDADWSYVVVPIGSGLKERRWTKTGSCIEGVTHSLETLSVNAPDALSPCFSFTYGDWTPANCVAGSQQTRTALGSSGGVQNAQCIGGVVPILNQNCPENTQTVVTGACSYGDSPVCSNDEITYSNSCNAVAAGATVSCQGECPCPAGNPDPVTNVVPSIVDESYPLFFGTMPIFIGDSLNKGVRTLIAVDMPKTLKNGFVGEIEYEQRIVIGSNSKFENSVQPTDDSPKAYNIHLGTTPSTQYLYNLTVNFDRGIYLTDLIGKNIYLFGRTYSVNSLTTNSKLFLSTSKGDLIEIPMNDFAVRKNQQTIDGTQSRGFSQESNPANGKITIFTISVTARDSDTDGIVVGSSFIDPVFENIKVNFRAVATVNDNDHGGQPAVSAQVYLVSDLSNSVSVCGNNVCESGENNQVCPVDCSGPVAQGLPSSTGTCSSGCSLDNNCVDFGYRSSAKYCSLSGMVDFKAVTISCDNSFECATNSCIAGQCSDSNILQKIVTWFRDNCPSFICTPSGTTTASS